MFIAGLKEVIIYSSPDDKKKNRYALFTLNIPCSLGLCKVQYLLYYILIKKVSFISRGFCFLEYESHKAASLAKRRLETGRVKVWSCDIIVDWADPQEEPDEGTMSQVF